MPSAKSALTRLAAQHPHCEQLLTSFFPLLAAQEHLAESLAPLELPVFDEHALAGGKAWLDGCLSQLLDAPFLAEAPSCLAEAAAEGFPVIKKAVTALGAFLAKNTQACRELAELGLKKRLNKVRAWSAAYEQDETAATVMASHLAGAAARRAARAAASLQLSFPGWSSALCPVCGSRPHGASIKGKEGKRYLQCSLCRHEWLFSRTTCPVCLQNSPQDIELYYLEGSKQLRAEVCKPCSHYLLCADTREFADDVPVELHLLCMMPLDLLMQEKKFIPVPQPKKKR